MVFGNNFGVLILKNNKDFDIVDEVVTLAQATGKKIYRSAVLMTSIAVGCLLFAVGF